MSFLAVVELFIVDTDASNHGLGGVCSPLIDGREKVISFYSRKLTMAERNYCVTRKLLCYESRRSTCKMD